MAEQTQPVIHAQNSAGVLTAPTPIRPVNLSPRSATAVSLTSKIGAALGLLGIAVVALFSLVLFARQRELKQLREQVAGALALEARQRPLFALAGIPYAEPALARLPEAKPAAIATPEAEPAAIATPEAEPAATAVAPAELAPTIYRAPRSWRRGTLILVGVPIAAALIAFGGYRLYEHLSSSSRLPSSSVAVAVFNATPSPGAAHRIAATLSRGRVHVGEVGDINASLSPGTYVLYPPGAQAEARRVARLLPSPPPTVEPIQPQVQEAVGHRNEIVVVVD